MFQPIKCTSRSLTLLLCYPILVVGQYWLQQGHEEMPLLYDRLTVGAREWIYAHLLLTVAMLLLFKAYLAISDYLRPTRGGWMASFAVFLTAISVFVMIGQYAIDLALVEIFKLPRELAVQTLEGIRANAVIRFLYLEPGSATGSFPLMLLPVLANVFMGMAFWFSGKMPSWSAWLFILAFGITNFCAFTQVGFGGWMHMAGYLLYSVAFIPVALGLWKKPAVPGLGDRRLSMKAA
jgi:hypothetical protein